MNKVKILAVDDDANVLQSITDNIHYHEITTELSSVKAIELLQNEQFDIFLVDYQMPKIDGIQLLEEIKRVYNDRPYISILCTAYGTTYLFKSELVRGLFAFFLEKPFEINSLKQVVIKAVTLLEKIQTRQKQQVECT